MRLQPFPGECGPSTRPHHRAVLLPPGRQPAPCRRQLACRRLLFCRLLLLLRAVPLPSAPTMAARSVPVVRPSLHHKSRLSPWLPVPGPPTCSPQDVLQQWCTEFIPTLGLEVNGNANTAYPNDIPESNNITNLQQCETEQVRPPACTLRAVPGPLHELSGPPVTVTAAGTSPGPTAPHWFPCPAEVCAWRHDPRPALSPGLHQVGGLPAVFWCRADTRLTPP